MLSNVLNDFARCRFVIAGELGLEPKFNTSLYGDASAEAFHRSCINYRSGRPTVFTNFTTRRYKFSPDSCFTTCFSTEISLAHRLKGSRAIAYTYTEFVSMIGFEPTFSSPLRLTVSKTDSVTCPIIACSLLVLLVYQI